LLTKQKRLLRQKLIKTEQKILKTKTKLKLQNNSETKTKYEIKRKSHCEHAVIKEAPKHHKIALNYAYYTN